jgi:hypothetical protein
MDDQYTANIIDIWWRLAKAKRRGCSQMKLALEKESERAKHLENPQEEAVWVIKQYSRQKWCNFNIYMTVNVLSIHPFKPITRQYIHITCLENYRLNTITGNELFTIPYHRMNVSWLAFSFLVFPTLTHQAYNTCTSIVTTIKHFGNPLHVNKNMVHLLRYNICIVVDNVCMHYISDE